MTFPAHELETRLADLYRRAMAETDRLTSDRPTPAGQPITDRQTSAAYARGLADALDLVRSLLPPDSPRTNAPEKPAKLHQMAPEQVADMTLSGCPMEDLVEAAFTFENMLLDLLEDDNTLPFDLYTGLSPAKLEDIIKKSADKICRIQGL